MTFTRLFGAGAWCALATVASLSAQTPTISLTTRPTPLLLGQNQFEVSLKTAKGQPIADAEVEVTLVMPPIPAIKHPEMRSGGMLKAAGSGRYSGIVMVTMAGEWHVTITARKAGKVLGQKKLTVKAQERVTSTPS